MVIVSLMYTVKPVNSHRTSTRINIREAFNKPFPAYSGGGGGTSMRRRHFFRPSEAHVVVLNEVLNSFTWKLRLTYLKTCLTKTSASLKNFCSGASVKAKAFVGVLLIEPLGLVCVEPAGEGGKARRTKWRNRPPRKLPWKNKSLPDITKARIQVTNKLERYIHNYIHYQFHTVQECRMSS